MTDRERLVQEKLPLIRRAVAIYLRKNPRLRYLRDDLLSAAALGLMQNVHRLQHARDSYLISAMLYRVAEAVTREDTVYIPLRSRLHATKNGKPITPVFCVPLPTQLVDYRVGDAFTTIIECCRNQRERDIVQLRAAGYTRREIATKIGMDSDIITRVLAEIETRYAGDVAISDAPPLETRKHGDATTCSCGQPVRFTNELRCEDCWAEDQQKFHGRSQRANTAREYAA